MRRAPVLGVLLAACVAACTTAETPPPPPTPAPSPVLRVRTLGPGGAVAGATVCAAALRGGEERCATTAAGGQVSFALAPGTYHVRADPPPAARLGSVPAQALTMTVDAARDLDLALPARARIAGTVRDDAQAPAAGATVCASAVGAEGGCARSAADGAYELALTPAAYKLEVSGPPGGRLVPQWYDDRADRGGADVVDVRGGDALGTDVTLGRGLILSGVVRAARDGHPVREAQVCIRTLAEPLPFQCERTNAAGEYAALRIPGRYYVWIVPPDHEVLVPQWYDRAITGVGARVLALNADTQLDVALNEGPSVRGRVIADGGEPVAGALVCVDTAFTTGRICRPTDADGRYFVTTRPETYIISLLPPERSDLVAFFWRDARSWVDADEISVGRADVTVNLVARHGVVLRGVVRDSTGRPLEDASVNVNDGNGPLAATYTGADGGYWLAVPPGDYTVDVFAPGFGELVSVVGKALAIRAPLTYDVTLPPANP